MAVLHRPDIKSVGTGLGCPEIGWPASIATGYCGWGTASPPVSSQRALPLVRCYGTALILLWARSHEHVYKGIGREEKCAFACAASRRPGRLRATGSTSVYSKSKHVQNSNSRLLFLLADLASRSFSISGLVSFVFSVGDEEDRPPCRIYCCFILARAGMRWKFQRTLEEDTGLVFFFLERSLHA